MIRFNPSKLIILEKLKRSKVEKEKDHANQDKSFHYRSDDQVGITV